MIAGIDKGDCIREGILAFEPADFTRMIQGRYKCALHDKVKRIKFEYL